MLTQAGAGTPTSKARQIIYSGAVYQVPVKGINPCPPEHLQEYKGYIQEQPQNKRPTFSSTDAAHPMVSIVSMKPVSEVSKSKFYW